MKRVSAKAPRLGDVAEIAGLSQATVSRFLNQDIVLPDATAERIHAAIAKLGYRPNPYARSLSRGESDMIGLAIPDIQNPFFAKLASALEVPAEAARLGVLLSSTQNRSEREFDYIERLRRNFVAGLLFATNRVDTGELAEAVNASGSNIVLVDEDIPNARVSRVFSDNVGGGYMAARHLLEYGHRHFAYISGPSNLMSAVERGRGFRKALAEAGSDCFMHLALHGNYSHQHGRDAMRIILDKAPETTAVFAGSDELTLGAIALMREQGLRPGEDTSLVSFDDVAPLDLFDPPVTAIRQPVREIAEQAFELLSRAIRGEIEDPVCLRLPTELVVRSSVSAPKARS